MSPEEKLKTLSTNGTERELSTKNRWKVEAYNETVGTTVTIHPSIFHASTRVAIVMQSNDYSYVSLFKEHDGRWEKFDDFHL